MRALYFITALALARGAVFQDEVASTRTRRAPPIRADGGAAAPPIPRRAAASGADSSTVSSGATSDGGRANAGAGAGVGASAGVPRRKAADGVAAPESRSAAPSALPKNPPARDRAEGGAGIAGTALRENHEAAFQKPAAAPDAAPATPFRFADADSARAAAGAAYDALSAAAAAAADAEADAAIGGVLVGAHLRAWALAALRAPSGALEPGTPLSSDFDRLFSRFASRQGFAPPAGDARPLPRALVLNNAATAFLLDAAKKMSAAHASLTAADAARAVADLEREHPRRKRGEL